MTADEKIQILSEKNFLSWKILYDDILIKTLFREKKLSWNLRMFEMGTGKCPGLNFL